jgi:hypothetical protein
MLRNKLLVTLALTVGLFTLAANAVPVGALNITVDAAGDPLNVPPYSEGILKTLNTTNYPGPGKATPGMTSTSERAQPLE